MCGKICDYVKTVSDDTETEWSPRLEPTTVLSSTESTSSLPPQPLITTADEKSSSGNGNRPSEGESAANTGVVYYLTSWTVIALGAMVIQLTDSF